MKKWVDLFDEVAAAEKAVGGSWEAVRSLLGGKGAGLFDIDSGGVARSAWLYGYHRSL